MSCYFPLAAYMRKEVNPSGKRSFQFSPNGSLNRVAYLLPCGKCVGCRLERARVWAVRCVHEARMHRDNCFLTLTYDACSLPANGSLIKRHLQLFMKRLRDYCFREHSVRIRFYACGEYGDLNMRPHYHVLLFGFEFADKKFYCKSGENSIYTSKVLDEIWGMGACKIGELNFDTACYVARYVMKKVDGKLRDEGHYLVYDADGVVSEREPEFPLMSRRPGIGASYYAKYGQEVRDHDTLVIKGREVPSVRYYDKLFERLDPKGYRSVKLLRGPKARDRASWEAIKYEQSSRRRVARAELVRQMMKQKKRTL